MRDDPTAQSADADDSELTTISIPREKAQAVLDFVAALDEEDAEVSGYMLPTMGSFANRPMAANQKHATGTGCLSSPTGWKCSDMDRTPGDE
ncbi:MAG: hypothetical protein WBW04_21175 [Nitrolancea sp.]